jgi:hypothetical protein
LKELDGAIEGLSVVLAHFSIIPLSMSALCIFETIIAARYSRRAEPTMILSEDLTTAVP